VRLDLPPGAERSGRAASATLPPKEQVRSARPGGEVGADHRPTSARLACDLCGGTRPRRERHRLVWESDSATRLLLAELCRDCATFADPLLELYGGHGRHAIRLVEEIRPAPQSRTAGLRLLGFSTRVILYLLIVAGSFLLVTLVTSTR
jgi:hypothetical protein